LSQIISQTEKGFLPAVQRPFNFQHENYHTENYWDAKTRRHFITVTKQTLSYLDHGLHSGIFFRKM